MKRSSCLLTYLSVCIATVSLVMLFPNPATAAPGDVLQQIDSPLTGISDMAWDGEALWLLDSDRTEAVRFDPVTQRVLARKVIGEGEVAGITVRNGKILTSDSSLDITSWDLAKSTMPSSPAATVDIGKLDMDAVGNLAFDGQNLWMGIIAGWSSRLVRIDPDSGKIVHSIYTHGYPEAVEADQGTLWTATSNMGRFIGTIYQYDPQTGRILSDFDAPCNYPAGLAATSEHLWCADGETGVLYKLSQN